MASKALPSPEVLRQLLRYEPETGKLFWKERDKSFFRDGFHTATAKMKAWNSRHAGKEAFTPLNSRGYRTGAVLGIMALAHRVAWAIHYGEWPKGWLDHINMDRADNRITNLREATPAENNYNRSVQSDNESGVKGVRLHKQSNKWQARISVDGKMIYLGSFLTLEGAADAYAQAAAKHRGEFLRLA